MRRLLVTALATTFVMALATAPAAAQEELGLTIDPVEGFPGTEITGEVSTDDVEAFCVTDTEEWVDIFTENFGDGNTLTPAEGTWTDLYLDAFYGGTAPLPANSVEGTAFQLIFELFPLGVALGLDGGAAWEASFIFAFATLAEEIVEVEAPGFDPFTGDAGPLVTPDVDPGLYAVAAACNTIGAPDEANVDAGLAALADTQAALEEVVCQALIDAGLTDNGSCLEVGLPATLPGYPLDVAPYLEEVLPIAFGELFVQDALGFELYCVLDAEGLCPSDEPPIEPVEPVDPEPVTPATPVTEAPRFTG